MKRFGAACLFALVCLWSAIAPMAEARGRGFRSQEALDEHYRKHGREFGNVTKQQYLEMAQELRDLKAGGDVLEYVRPDSVITRFHRKKGWFGAYNPSGTIRTFFIPNDGERYFHRQAARHDAASRKGKP